MAADSKAHPPDAAAIEELGSVYDIDLEGEYSRTTLLLAQRQLHSLCSYMDEHPGAVSNLLSGDNHSVLAEIEERIVAAVDRILNDRVPGISETEASVTAAIVAPLTLTMCATYDRAGQTERALLRDEIPYALCAYLYAKFPPPNDYTWLLPTRGIRPSTPSRRDFTESVVLTAGGSANR